MRPTDLQYRSPKEKTAEFLFPKITNNGNLLLEIISTKTHPSLPQDRRFQHYEAEAKRTGFRVGPGSYNQSHNSVGKQHIKGAHAYKKFHRNPDTSNNGYLFIGNQLMFDASFVIPSKKGPRQEISHMADTCELNVAKFSKAERSTTANTPGKNVKSRMNVMSPNYEEFSQFRNSR